MFLGHLGMGMAAKRWHPNLPLWILLMACQWSDLLWPILVLLGAESVGVDPQATVVTPLNFFHYPWSHSLATNMVWGILFGLGWYVKRRDFQAAVILFLLVISHWVLDWLSHRPDMPLVPYGTNYGLGLWNHFAGTLIVEALLFGGGIFLYLQRAPRLRRGLWISLLLTLTMIYIGNIFGPKPPLDAPPELIAGPALALWLLIPWGYWIEKPRS